MTSRLLRWSDVLQRPGRVLLIVNSNASQDEEINRCVDALSSSGGLERVSVICPSAVTRGLIHRGIDAQLVLPFEVEVGYFLGSDRALQWAIRQNAALVLGTEPYALNNEEVKTDFEGRIAPLLGNASLVAHTLPADQVFILELDDIWKRAGRQDAVASHRERVATTLEQLHTMWSSGGAQSGHAVDLAASLMRPAPRPTAPALVAALSSCRRLHSALHVDGGYALSPVRVVSDPPGHWPHAGVVGGRLDVVRRPAQRAAGVKFSRAKLTFRGVAEGPYSYLLMSRPTTLSAGDAAVAEGCLYRGGVTVGLVKSGAWAGRVDIVDRGEFIAAAVATESGSYALVIAHCLQGQERRAALAIRQFGFRRAG